MRAAALPGQAQRSCPLAAAMPPLAHLGLAALAGKHILEQRHGRRLVAALPLQEAVPPRDGLLDVIVHAQGSPVCGGQSKGPAHECMQGVAR